MIFFIIQTGKTGPTQQLFFQGHQILHGFKKEFLGPDNIFTVFPEVETSYGRVFTVN